MSLRLRASADLRHFLAAFAGSRGVAAVALEGLGLILLVPLLGIVFSGSLPQGRLQHTVDALFGTVGAGSTLARLAWLLALFAVLMVLRAVVVSARDVVMTRLQIGFVEAQRLRVAQHLAAAPWNQVARLQHARVVRPLLDPACHCFRRRRPHGATRRCRDPVHRAALSRPEAGRCRDRLRSPSAALVR